MYRFIWYLYLKPGEHNFKVCVVIYKAVHTCIVMFKTQLDAYTLRRLPYFNIKKMNKKLIYIEKIEAVIIILSMESLVLDVILA